MKELNLLELQKMPNGHMIAGGHGKFPQLYGSGNIRWIAVKGSGHDDWAIYYHLERHSYDFIRAHGDKVTSPETIRLLVPCTDEVLRRYRK